MTQYEAYWICHDCNVFKLCLRIGGAYNGLNAHKRANHGHNVSVHYFGGIYGELATATRLK